VHNHLQKFSLKTLAVCLKLLQNFAKPRKTQLQPDQKDVSVLLPDCVDTTGEHSLPVAPAPAQKSWLTRRNASTLDMAKGKPPHFKLPTHVFEALALRFYERATLSLKVLT